MCCQQLLSTASVPADNASISPQSQVTQMNTRTGGYTARSRSCSERADVIEISSNKIGPTPIKICSSNFDLAKGGLHLLRNSFLKI